ncbi:cysteine/serine endopeptidase inhibitor [Streptomyces sp. P9(2023)]|uniref:cysteine/serine endopeptidase inhibitor n=1 Tax=Streptomyces sp. P9(2023) TaxID=3064394 RepID=UPI0028F433EC|nr:cysteine/serine endopeptidase inhibitor [Streptomyces sp. P9(2023)]MDT9687071.1 cysteine/serine endopeptidase inhibitor [Streptomyces sp. P9(2023)]
MQRARLLRRSGHALLALLATIATLILGTGTAFAQIPIGQPMTGRMTHYNDRGYGACGTQIDPTTQDLVAVSAAWWTAANPNNDQLCAGISVEVSYGGKTITVPVRDKCPSCASTHIDLSETAFQQLAPLGTGLVRDITWKFVGSGGGDPDPAPPLPAPAGRTGRSGATTAPAPDA